MRTLVRIARFSGLLILAATGCNRSSTSPASSTPVSTAPATLRPPANAALPATIVVDGVTDTGHRITALSEEPGRSPVLLSRPGADASFVAALPDHRALLLEQVTSPVAATRLVIARVDGTRVELAPLPAGKYGAGGALRTLSGGTAVVELIRAGDPRRDLYVLSLSVAGTAPRLLAEDASLVAVSADRVAFLSSGIVRSLKLDGSSPIQLGANDGLDEVAASDDAGRLLLTLHGVGHGDVRVVSLDNALRVDLGRPDADEEAVAFAPSGRVLFTRATPGGTVLVSAALDGSGERTLTAAALDVTPRHVTPSGLALLETAAGALVAVDTTATPADVRVLDPAAGHDLVVGTVTADRVVYTGTGPSSPSLRTVRLDGKSLAVLCEKPLWQPFFCALGADGRVVFHRALAGQLEGGRAYSVNLDGSDLHEVGTDIFAADGSPNPVPDDQDFLGVTPAGNVILEAEYEGAREPQLLVAVPGTTLARELPRQTGLHFAGLIP